MTETLDAIYRRYRPGLFTLALSITGCPADAEDAIHEAFTRLCRNASSGATPPAADPVAYTFSAVHNAAVDRLRRRRAAIPPEPAMLLAPCVQTAPDSVANAERFRAVAASVDALPPDQRTVVILRIFSGLNYRQAAELLDIPIQTVVSRYNAALSRLKPQLKEWL